MIRYTRSDYMEKRCSYDEYYQQFVTVGVKLAVNDRFGIKRLTEAYEQDKSFNSIPLKEWDETKILYKTVCERIREAGDFPTLSGQVCIAKQAARMLVLDLPTN